MKNRLHIISSPLTAAIATLALASTPASAVIYYWDSNNSTAGAGTTPNGTWGSSAFWSTNASGGNATANPTTTALDRLRFSAGTDAVGSYTVTVSGAQTARQLSLEYGNITFSGGTINLSSNATGSSSNVGAGIVLASTAGNATISSNLTIDGLQMLNIAAGKSLTLNTGNFTRNAGSSLNVLSTGTVTSTMNGLNSGALVNGIVGPWATYGTGTSTRYATFSGHNIAGLTGTSAATAADVTDTTGAVNYDLEAVGALGADASVNTLRYTGAAGTISGDLTTNGLLNAGTGLATLSGNITIGSTRELVVTPAAQSFTISGVLKDNALGASSLLVTQLSSPSQSLGLSLSNNNTYSGGTTVSNARLSITANNALGTGAVSVLKGNVGNATFAGSIGDYGGVVEVSNNITWSNDMTLAGQGYNAYGGALRNISGNNTHTGTITAADVNTRITASGGTLFLNGNINLTTAGAYANFLQHAGGDIRLGGNITGSATSINVLGSSGGTNFLILDRAFAWGNSTGLSLGSGSSTNYGRVDLNGNDQTVTSLAAAGTVATQNLITNRSSTLASFTINNTSNFNATPSFSGNLVVVKNGGGQATMSTIGTHTGGWIINNGTVSTGSAQTFGTGNVTINSGGNATLGLNAGTSSYSNNFSITGSGSGNGALQTNTSGNYTISGPVALTGNAMIGSRAGSGSGSGMIFTGGISTGGANRTLTLNAFGGTSGNNTVNTNFISLNSTTNLGTGGTLTMGTGISAGGTGTFNINVGGNTWGTTIVQGRSTAGESSNATLNLGAANALGSSSSVLQLGNFNTALEGITVNLNGNNQTIGGLRSFGSTGSASANGTRTVTSASAATLTIDNSSDYLFDGAISGAISLTKNGTATQTLSGNNSYTGATTVNNGALVLSSANAVAGTSGITVANGGRINTSVITALNDKAVTISGNGIGTGAVSFNEGANRASNATFTLAGNATIRQSQYANLDLNNGIAESSAGSVLTLMGGTKPDASFNGSAIRLYGNNTFSGGLVIDSLKVVPTNSGWAGAGNGAAGVTLQNGGGLDLAFENRSIAGNLTMSDGFIYSSGAARTFQAANYLITGGGTVASNTSLIGSGALIKSGAATLTLSGSNSYGGATSVNQGVLSITNANALGSTAGGTTVSSNAALNLSGNITVTGEALSLSGGGISTSGALRSISGNNTWTGDITIGTGNTRIVSDANLLTISGNITGSGSTSTLFQGNGDTLVSGNIGGALSVSTSNIRLVSSVLTLSGNNTFSGTIQHNNGILALSGGSALADSTGIQLNGANATLSVATSETIGSLIGGLGGNISIANGQTLTINQGSSQTFNGTISGSASLTKIGAAALTLTGNQTYSDGTTVNAGALNVTSTGSLASGSAFTLGASATANLSNSGQTLGAVSNSNTASNALNFSAASGSVTLASLSGAGNTRFGSNAVVNGGIGSGTVNAIGSLTANITGGTTTVGGVATIATMSGGTANLNGATSSIGTFNGGNIALGNSTTLSVSSGTSSGVISGGGSLNKTGAGALQLLGINSYTGGTTISEGTLAVNGSLAGNVTVNTEAILQGAGSIGGALSVSGQLAPGNSIESIGAASVSFLSGSTYAYEFESASLNGDLLYTLGELNITTGTLLSLTDLSSGVLAANSKLTLISYGSRSGGLFTYNGNTLTDGSKFTIGQNEWLFRYDDTVAGSNFSGDQTGATQYVTMTVIPEPSVAMMAGSLAMMALLRRRRD